MLGQQQENQARLKNAEGDLERYQKLVAEGLITKQQVTTQEALVQQYRGALQANDAQVATRACSWRTRKITAPIGGRLGLRQVDAGNLIRGGDENGLVVITQMRPISVIFTVPEAELPAVLDAYRRGKRPQVEAWDRSEASMLATGTLQTVDNQIDTTTGTIKLRAQFDNTDEKLFPNQFVNMRLRVKTLQNATVIPAAAVQRASFGTFVYVVKPDNTVTIRRIELGPPRASASRSPRGSPSPSRWCSRASTTSPKARRSKSSPRAARQGATPRARAPARARAARRRQVAAGAAGGAGRGHEHLAPVHHAAGRDRPADGRVDALGPARLSACCRCRRCRRWTTRRSGSSRSIRAPARRS